MTIHKYFHWAYHTLGWKHNYNIGTGLFIWLFLLLTRPFGVYVNDLQHFFALAFFLLPVGISFILISYLTDYTFERSLKKNLSSSPEADRVSWGVKLILFVHVVLLMQLIRCGWTCFDWLEYFEIWFAFSLLIFLTYLPISLYAKSKFYHSLVGQDPIENGQLTLTGDGKEKLNVGLNELLLLKADDNYVDVFVSSSEYSSKKPIRSTLKALKKQLSEYPQFQQVHRSYIVNMKFTRKLNSTTLEVKNGQWSMQVPISPSFKDSVQDLLS